jgi:serine/threonine-protein kinase
LSGRYPVEGATVDAIAALHAGQQTVGLSERRPDLPPGLVRIVDDALARDPARRYRNAGAMEEDLRRVLDLQNALDEQWRTR